MVTMTRMPRVLAPLLVLSTALMLASCSSRDSVPDGMTGDALDGPLTEQRWNLLLLGTSERLSMPEAAWFEVDGDGRLVGSDGCNAMQGRVRLGDNQRIEVTELATTRRGCPRLEDAARVTEMLETAYRYLIDHDRLVFFGPDQRVLGGWRKAS